MKRLAVLIVGAAVYVMFLGILLYAVGFVGNFGVPTRLDGVVSVSVSVGWALAINLLLLALFALQHSVMARPWFKSRSTRVIPEPLERSTFVLCTNLVLILMFWQWQPMGWHGLGRSAAIAPRVALWAVCLWMVDGLGDHFFDQPL